MGVIIGVAVDVVVVLTIATRCVVTCGVSVFGVANVGDDVVVVGLGCAAVVGGVADVAAGVVVIVGSHGVVGVVGGGVGVRCVIVVVVGYVGMYGVAGIGVGCVVADAVAGVDGFGVYVEVSVGVVSLLSVVLFAGVVVCWYCC